MLWKTKYLCNSPTAVGIEYDKYTGNLKLLQEVTA